MRSLRNMNRMGSKRSKKALNGRNNAASKSKSKPVIKRRALIKHSDETETLLEAHDQSLSNSGIVPSMSTLLKQGQKHAGSSRRKPAMSGGVGYTFNLKCKDGGIMRPEAYSECPEFGPADPKFPAALY
jgi:hypothetical protein